MARKLARAGFFLLACAAVTSASAQNDAPPRGSELAARLSRESAAAEYWDVTAWLRSGHRFVARFLITNLGPGSRTAAAVGRLVLPGGEVVSIDYGRTRDAWSLTGENRRLKIASAVLDLSDPVSFVEVDSDKRGVKVRLEFTRLAPPVSTLPVPDSYWVDVLMPVAVRGSFWLRGMPAAESLEGTLALTHTWMERDESDLIQRRSEMFAQLGDAAVYLSSLVLPNGDRRGTLLVQRGSSISHRADDALMSQAGEPVVLGDARYPVASIWNLQAREARASVRLRRELLRWDPLELVPQPFRFLLLLRARPHRMWADASLELALIDGDAPARTLEGAGVVSVTFMNPETAR